MQDDRSQIVVGIDREETRFNDCPRSYHTDDFTRKYAFGGLVTNLLTNGNMIAFVNEACQVIFDGVVRNACQGGA